MRIEFEEIPLKEGYITEIHLCVKCPEIKECEVPECKKKGWCHTFSKKGEIILDWIKAKMHLSECEKAYTEIGMVGYFSLLNVIGPLRERLNCGERTEELYQAIMGIEL